MRVFTLLRSLPAGAKRFVHEVRMEYRARGIDRALRNLERDEAEYRRMSEAQRLQYERDNAEVLARSYELRAARQAKEEARGYYARRERATERASKIMGDE